MNPRESSEKRRYHKPPLTPIEDRMLAIIRTQRSNPKELSASLEISVAAVNQHVKHLKAKFPGKISVVWGLGVMFTGSLEDLLSKDRR